MEPRIVSAVLVCALLAMAGCSGGGGGGGGGSASATPPPGVSGKVDVSASIVPTNPEPNDRPKLKVTVKNGLLDSISEVTAKVLTTPVNMVIQDADVWKTISSNMRNGADDDASWSVTVKDKASFVPDTTSEKLTIRAKYKTSVRAANTFKVSDTADAKEGGKASTTSDIVPITIVVDPKEVPLDKDESVSIDVAVSKKGKDAASGVLEDQMTRFVLSLPGSDDFDLARATCEFEGAVAPRSCTVSSDAVTLENAAFKDGEMRLRLTLPLKEGSLGKLRGSQRSVTATLEGVWLYTDRDVTVTYALGKA